MQKIVDIRRSLWYSIHDPYGKHVWATNPGDAARILGCTAGEIDRCLFPDSVPQNKIVNA